MLFIRFKNDANETETLLCKQRSVKKKIFIVVENSIYALIF